MHPRNNLWGPLFSAALAVATALGSPSAIAEPEDKSDSVMMKLLEALEKNGTITSETAEMLRQAAEEEYAAKMEKREKRKEKKAEQVQLSLKEGKLRLKSGDGDFEFGIHGRAQADYALYDGGAGQDLGVGSRVRRARLALKATLWRHWHFLTQYDFVGDGHLRTVDLRYTGVPDWQFQFGHFHQPFGMEHQSSSKTITFMERALGDSWSPSRDVGIAAQYVGDMWRAKFGTFTVTDSSGNDTIGRRNSDASWDLTGRINVTPLHQAGERVLHLGFAGSRRWLASRSTIRFRERPESYISDVHLVETPPIDAKRRALYAFEAGYLSGPFSIMGEYRTASVDRDTGEDLSFASYYGQFSYILTGESRQYRRKTGTWGGVNPTSIVGKGGLGAWEVAARFSSIDLKDADIDGGEQDNFSLALNWYLTPTIRFNANYVSVLSLKRGPLTLPEPSAFQMRAQYEF